MRVLTIVAYIYLYSEMSLFGFGPAEGMINHSHDYSMLFGDGRSLTLSPFLGGFHQTYLLMLEKHTLLQRLKSAKQAQIPELLSQARYLQQELNDLEFQIETACFVAAERSAEVSLVRAKHLLTSYANSIHLTKITQPDASIAQAEIQEKVTKAVDILRTDDVLEKHHPALTWPLVVLACAALRPSDFAVITSVMAQVIPITEATGAETLRYSLSLLNRFRAGHGYCREQFHDIRDTTDFLREPQLLLSMEQRRQYALE